jgi:hypothetical protein
VPAKSAFRKVLRPIIASCAGLAATRAGFFPPFVSFLALTISLAAVKIGFDPNPKIHKLRN